MSTASTFEQEMLALINEERTSRGLNPLKLETQLNASAEDHSTWMLNTDTFSHTGAGGTTATERMEDAGFDFSGNWRSGENIAWQSERGAEGISDDVEQLHQSLMNSPGHRANILNPDYEYIGIGIEEGDYNGWDAVMVTQNFATTDAEVMLDNGSVPTAPMEDQDEPVADIPVAFVTDEIQLEEPIEVVPATPVIETEEPVAETPAATVTQTEKPVEATPATTVIETEEPVKATINADVTVTQEPDMPGEGIPDILDDDYFDVGAFLAAIEDFVTELVFGFDDFRKNDPAETDADPTEDDFLLTWARDGGTLATIDESVEMVTDTPGGFFAQMLIENGCLVDIA